MFSTKFRTLMACAIFSTLLPISYSSVALAAEAGAPFSATGEQLDVAPPNEWKLAWMDGRSDGSYLIEYIPGKEEIDSWRDGYLAIERLHYPPVEIRKEIENAKSSVSEVALFQFVQNAKKACSGRHEPMMQRVNSFNGIRFAVSGGFCDRYGPAAPYGEGAFIAFAEGKDYLFRIQYGWRPKSIEEKKSNLPWRITPDKAEEYLGAIKAASLCAGPGQPGCKHRR